MCDFSCSPGYHAQGRHFCNSTGHFNGGSCFANECTDGLSLARSPTVCSGTTGANCTYTCDDGYHVDGVHTCDTNGTFKGGGCAANACSGGTTLAHSAFTCSGVTGDACAFTCEPGYSPTGQHVCGTDGVFSGGSCEPNACTEGLTIAHSEAVCSGVTTDTCTFTCENGYSTFGTHTCGTDGAFFGGVCIPNQCIYGKSIGITVCSGTTGDVCSFECAPGYAATNQHVCGADGEFTGGSCEPEVCVDGGRVANSPTRCVGYTTETCDFTCDAGYSAVGIHMCGFDNATSGMLWAGGRCQPHPCDADVLHRSTTTCYGYTSDECDYACDPGYHTSGAHVCRSDGSFAGGACLPNSCTSLAVPHALTTCTGATTDVCNFECGPGYMATGPVTCQATGVFEGGECEQFNACAAEEDDCHQDALCSSTGPGEHDCSCRGSTFGDGHTCTAWTACVPGSTFQTVAGTSTTDRVCSAVTSCVVGQFIASPGTVLDDVVCANCSVGTFQPNATSLDCPTCPAGVIDHDHNPATPCVACSPGTQQVSEGQTECTVCPVNWHDDDSSPATACAPCPDGHIAPLAGSTSCVPLGCSGGLQLPHALHPCSGVTGDICDVECEPGYALNGVYSCRDDGFFRGATCDRISCNPGQIPHSSTTCAGVTGDECAVVCDDGYRLEGTHTCRPTRMFEGGRCELYDMCLADIHDCAANAVCNRTGDATYDCACIPGTWGTGRQTCSSCVAGKYAESAGNVNASACIDCAAGKYGTVVGSASGNDCVECEYGRYAAASGGNNVSDCTAWSVCELGATYQTVGPTRARDRVCTGVKECLASEYLVSAATLWADTVCATRTECVEGLLVPHAAAACSGVTEEECSLACDAGYAPSGRHVCGRNGAFAGGACVATACAEDQLEHSSFVCRGATGDVCSYSCDEGFVPWEQPHTCMRDGNFAGGRCICNGKYWDADREQCMPFSECIGQQTVLRRPTPDRDRRCGVAVQADVTVAVSGLLPPTTLASAIDLLVEDLDGDDAVELLQIERTIDASITFPSESDALSAAAEQQVRTGLAAALGVRVDDVFIDSSRRRLQATNSTNSSLTVRFEVLSSDPSADLAGIMMQPSFRDAVVREINAVPGAVLVLQPASVTVSPPEVVSVLTLSITTEAESLSRDDLQQAYSAIDAFFAAEGLFMQALDEVEGGGAGRQVESPPSLRKKTSWAAPPPPPPPPQSSDVANKGGVLAILAPIVAGGLLICCCIVCCCIKRQNSKNRERLRASSAKALQKAVSSNCTIHCGGLEGELEEEPKLKALFQRFGTVLVATVRHRREPATETSAAKVSWALVTFPTPGEADAAINGSDGLGIPNLVTRKLDLEQAVASTGSMGKVALMHQEELENLDMEDAFDAPSQKAVAKAVQNNCTIHVGGLEGDLEHEAALVKLFRAFGTVRAATVRYRREPATPPYSKVSWALITFEHADEVKAALGGSARLGVPNLVTRKLDFAQALGSKGSMGEIAIQHRNQLEGGVVVPAARALPAASDLAAPADLQDLEEGVPLSAGKSTPATPLVVSGPPVAPSGMDAGMIEKIEHCASHVAAHGAELEAAVKKQHGPGSDWGFLHESPEESSGAAYYRARLQFEREKPSENLDEGEPPETPTPKKKKKKKKRSSRREPGESEGAPPSAAAQELLDEISKRKKLLKRLSKRVEAEGINATASELAIKTVDEAKALVARLKQTEPGVKPPRVSVPASLREAVRAQQRSASPQGGGFVAGDEQSALLAAKFAGKAKAQVAKKKKKKKGRAKKKSEPGSVESKCPSDCTRSLWA